MALTTATVHPPNARLREPDLGPCHESLEGHPDRLFPRHCECCEAVAWGRPWELGTAAFWVHQASEFAAAGSGHMLGRTLREEIAVCMLGGYGVPGPVGNAAFLALREAGVFAEPLDENLAAERMAKVLEQPLNVAPGRSVRYRFHRQRPRRLAAALAQLTSWESAIDDLTDLALRDNLVRLPGVGPKTASWIVRNHRGSDAVAIIDIHIHRAGLAAGAFCPNWILPRDYHRFEDAFLTWAHNGLVSAADMDAAIWQLLSSLGPHARAITSRSDATTKDVALAELLPDP